MADLCEAGGGEDAAAADMELAQVISCPGCVIIAAGRHAATSPS